MISLQQFNTQVRILVQKVTDVWRRLVSCKLSLSYIRITKQGVVNVVVILVQISEVSGRCMPAVSAL